MALLGMCAVTTPSQGGLNEGPSLHAGTKRLKLAHSPGPFGPPSSAALGGQLPGSAGSAGSAHGHACAAGRGGRGEGPACLGGRSSGPSGLRSHGVPLDLLQAYRARDSFPQGRTRRHSPGALHIPPTPLHTTRAGRRAERCAMHSPPSMAKVWPVMSARGQRCGRAEKGVRQAGRHQRSEPSAASVCPSAPNPQGSSRRLIQTADPGR